tara:strand:- start:965 stop:1177 length:213 start_codon:yes stop_codon:yes gene_type:complete
MSNSIEDSTCPDCGKQMLTEYNSEPAYSVVHYCNYCGFYQGVVYGYNLDLSEEEAKKYGLVQLVDHLHEE